MALDPKVWGPHYWFFLHTVAMCYPHRPNTITKKKHLNTLVFCLLPLPQDNQAYNWKRTILAMSGKHTKTYNKHIKTCRNM